MANGTLKVSNIQTSSGSGTITLGQSGETIALGSGATATGFGSDSTPAFRATMSADQSISNESFTKGAFNTETWDTDSAYDTSNYRFTVPSGEAGKYCFVSQAAIDNLDSGEFIATAYYINGTRDDKSYNTQWVSKSTNGFGYCNNVYIVNLSASDYVEFFVSHNEGASQNLEADYSYFGGFKLGGV
jgi:hypothetical protein|tara:strand:+ start:257 stop:817 length:561 start_codon:yes stop_codon:yes gene_type:complete